MRRERKTGRCMAAILLGMLIAVYSAPVNGQTSGRLEPRPEALRGGGLGHRPDAGDLLAVGQPGGGVPGAGGGQAADRKPAAPKPVRSIRYGSRAGEPAGVAVHAAGAGDRAGPDGAVHEPGWRDAQRPRRVAGASSSTSRWRRDGTQDFTPERPGVMILACDVHLHMRGYVVVSPTPWVQVCSREGRFRLEDVPDGRYVLNVWHEMGEPLRKEIVVEGGKALELPELVLAGPSAPARVGGRGATRRLFAPGPRWSTGSACTLAASRAGRDATRRAGQGPAAGRGCLLGRIRGVRHGDRRAAAPGLRPGRRARAAVPAVPLGGPRGGRTPASRVGPGRPEPQPAARPGRRRARAQRQGRDRRGAHRREPSATARRPISRRWPLGSMPPARRADPGVLLQALRRGFHRGRPAGRPGRRR